MEASSSERLRLPGAPAQPVASNRLVQYGIAAAILTGLFLRLLWFSSPPFDAHSFRQTQTLATIEFFHRDGIDLLHPRTLYMGYPGVFVLELPVFQAMAAMLYNLAGPHLEVVRLLNILFGAASTGLLFLSCRLLIDTRVAVLASLFYWLAPLNACYQRSMLIDPMAVCSGMLSFYCLAWLAEALQRPPHWGSLAGWLHLAAFLLATWLAAMMKALYLWPTTLLFFWLLWTRRLRLGWPAALFLIVFAFSGASFLLWNRYAANMNDRSPFTRGVQPTSLLGFSALGDPQYYREMIIRRPKWWLGPWGAIFYPVGLLALWNEREDRARALPLLLFTLIAPAYLLAFPFINGPHNYYQLVITPFLAVVSANGVRWALRTFQNGMARSRLIRFAPAALYITILISAPLTYVFWFKGAKPNERILRFQSLCAGRIVPSSLGMVFVSSHRAASASGSQTPEFLYAARLWGYARVAANNAEAAAYFRDTARVFPNFQYVVLYGIGKGDWLPEGVFHLSSADPQSDLWIYVRNELPLESPQPPR